MFRLNALFTQLVNAFKTDHSYQRSTCIVKCEVHFERLTVLCVFKVTGARFCACLKLLELKFVSCGCGRLIRVLLRSDLGDR